MNEPAPTPDLWPCRLYAERKLGGRPSLVEIGRAIATLLPRHLHTGPFEWDIDSQPPRRIALEDRALQDLLDRGLQGRPFLLADRPAGWTTLFAIGVTEHEGIEYVDIALPGSRQPQLADLDGMMGLATAVARASGAYIAYTDDSALGHTYAGRRARERGYENLPADARDLVGAQPPFEDVPGLAGPLPQMLLRTDLPADRIPAEVQWINWWNAAMVDELGRDRVLGAGWERVTAHPDGSLTLAATREPPDLTKRADIDRLVRIVAALDLVEIQQRAARGN